MSNQDENQTIQKTEWTNSLVQDLYAALTRKREDDVVRAFAQELIKDKGLPIGYLVRKVEDDIGPAEAERLDILVRGRHAVEKSKAERPPSKGGVRGLVKKLFG